jgi:hypothetical protein
MEFQVASGGSRKKGDDVTSRLAAFVALVTLTSAPPAARAGQEPPPPPPTSVGGCPVDPAAFHRCALEKAKTFAPPRTPDGRPDLQGYWRSLLATPFSVEEVTAAEPLTRNPVMPWTIGPGMIVDPPGRRIPYQPWAAAIGRKGINHQKYIDPRTACAIGGVPRLALQDANQIVQPPGGDHVLWLFDDHHARRVIPTDGRPHVGAGIKLWGGDSVGHWEGSTLVIDVTNLNGYTWFDDAGNFYTDAAHLVERLTPVDADTIHYQVTLEDPNAYTRPWTMVWALVREKEPGFELIEEACLEGERDLPRFQELGFRFYFGESWRAR